MIIKNKGYVSVRYSSHINVNETLSEVAKRNSYILRLCSLVNSFIGPNVVNKGNVIMLTFTYNNENLPFAINPDTNERVPVFSRNHVKTFLNRLKVRHSRFMKGFYKYFICFEYGKNTKRQHLHGLFCLSPECDLRKFVDTCRELWCYGYLFPSPHGNPYEDAKLRHAGKGASYAAKYVCKDLSYYELPSVQRYVEYIDKQNDEVKSQLRDALPRIYQSNGVGAELVSQLSENFDEVSKYGLLNPLTNKRAPIPYYVYNKFFFKTIPSFDSRVGKNGKILYDRVMIKDVDLFVSYKFDSLYRSIENVTPYFDTSISRCKSFLPYADSLSDCVSSLKHITGVDDRFTLAYMFVIYKDYVRCSSDLMLPYVDTFSDLFTINFVEKFIINSCNTYQNYKQSLEYNKLIPLVHCFSHSDTAKAIFSCLDRLCDIFSYFREDLQLLRESDFQNAERLREMLRTYKYPTNLC